MNAKTRTQMLQDISEQIKELQQKHSILERSFRKKSREKIDSIPPKYHYKVAPPGPNDRNDSFRIVRTLTNFEVYEDIKLTYGYPSCNGFETSRKVVSVAYFRKDKVVTHDGGGWLLLDDPFFCSDEEWDLLSVGNQSIIHYRLKESK